MYFKSPQELVEFFNKLNLEESVLVFKDGSKTELKEEKDCACKGHGQCQCATKVSEGEEKVAVDLTKTNDIIVESFSDDPTFRFEVTEDEESVFYVKDYEAVENACGTGKITLEDRVSHMNMCEMENKATVELNLTLEGSKLHNIPFRLEKTEGEPYLLISKAHLG